MVEQQIEEETPFNMAMLYYYEIQQIMRALSDSYITGDINTIIVHLENLRTKVSFKLSVKEETELDTLFNSINTKVTLTKKNSNYKNGLNAALRNTERQILKLMYRYKMIFPNISTIKGIKKLEARYGVKHNE